MPLRVGRAIRRSEDHGPNNPAHLRLFAPFNRAPGVAAQPKDVNDRDDTGENSEEIESAVKFVRDAYHQAAGIEPDDKATAAAKAVRALASAGDEAERAAASAALIIAAGRATGVIR